MRRRRRRCLRRSKTRPDRAPSPPRFPRGWLRDRLSAWLLFGGVDAIEQLGGVGIGTVVGPFDGGVNLLGNLAAHSIEIVCGGPTLLNHEALQARDRILGGPFFPERLGHIVGAIVG